MKIHTLDLNFLDKTNAIAAFLIESSKGHVLVECGPHSTFPILEQALVQKGLKISDIKHLFLSHIHFDHAGAAWAFAKQGTKIYVHPKGLPHLAQPEKLYNSAKMIYGDKMEKLWGRMESIEDEYLIAPEHGEKIEVEGLQLTAWYTPGHASHHIVWEVVKPHSRCKPVLFAGDVAGVKIKNGLVVPPCPPPDIDIEKWQFSIDLMKKLKPETLYLTHFGKITNKIEHLNELSQRLINWANWMKPHFENQTPMDKIVPEFQNFVKQELITLGINAQGIARYEAANPSYMAVAGLMRYWAKKSS
jgi:glyoxylase-like metal-dependent hydrolase (beta-lactamase superfamily II)